MKPNTLLLVGAAGIGALFLLGSKSSGASSSPPGPGPAPAPGTKLQMVPGKTYQLNMEARGDFNFDPSRAAANKDVMDAAGMHVVSVTSPDPTHASIVIAPSKSAEIPLGVMFTPDPTKPGSGFVYTSGYEVQNVTT